MRGILGSGRTRSVSFRPSPNSSGWWWLISSVFLTRTFCCKITYANVYYGVWPGWAVSVSVLLVSFLAGESPWTEDWQAVVHEVPKSWTQLND